MCVSIIGHCQCLRCLELPIPGKLLRVEFCEKQQAELAGIWTNFLPHERKLIPCKDMAFDRMHEPRACHFKKHEAVNKGPNRSKTTAQGNTVGDIATSFNSGTFFKAINASAIKPSPINDNSAIAHASAIARAALAVSAKTTAIAQTRGGATSSDNLAEHNSDSDNKTDNPIIATAVAVPMTPSKNKEEQQFQPETTRSPDSVPPNTPNTTYTNRTPLPSSRPLTPRVIQATAAAAAAAVVAATAQNAADPMAAEGQWTHEETIKLLALRVREVEYADMGEVSFAFRCCFVYTFLKGYLMLTTW